METKRCNKCELEKPLDCFYRAKRNAGGYYHSCKTCKREVDALYYQQESSKKERILQRRQEMRNRIDEYKKAKGCCCCPESEPIALDFHHTNSDKEFTISQSVMNRSWQAILREIEKCIVLCANCHRKVHAGLLVPPAEQALSLLNSVESVRLRQGLLIGA